MVWDPARITPRPWPGVIEFYRRIEDRNAEFRPMRLLAEHVASQPYAGSIFGATSGTALLVTAHAGADWMKHGVRIDLDLVGTICFVLQEHRGARPHVILRSETDNVVASFEGFLRKARWLS